MNAQRSLHVQVPLSALLLSEFTLRSTRKQRPISALLREEVMRLAQEYKPFPEVSDVQIAMLTHNASALNRLVYALNSDVARLARAALTEGRKAELSRVLVAFRVVCETAFQGLASPAAFSNCGVKCTLVSRLARVGSGSKGRRIMIRLTIDEFAILKMRSEHMHFKVGALCRYLMENGSPVHSSKNRKLDMGPLARTASNLTQLRNHLERSGVENHLEFCTQMNALWDALRLLRRRLMAMA